MERIAVLRYAKALFELAVERGEVELYNKACTDILAVFEADKDLLAVVNHLAIPADQKMQTMKAIFEGKIPEDFLGIFGLVFRRGRQRELSAILERFGQLYREHMRIATAKLYAAAELPQDKLNEISQVLGKKLEKTIEFEKVIDPSLIAGFRVEVDGFVFDASTKNQINVMKKQLLAAR